MKIIKFSLVVTMLVILSSCTETLQFPVSDVTPAADITVEIEKQQDPNYLVTLVAKNLASPERLHIPKNNYVIWVVSAKGIVRNVGHFNQENAVKSTYKASFPYQPIEIFITAENEEGRCIPGGTEITRLNLKKDKK